MSWASIANNQTVSLANLQDAVNNGVFTLKNAIPVSNKQTNKSEAEYYVYIDPISKATNQLVVKSNLVANTSTSTTSTSTTPPPVARYALAGSGSDLYISNNGGANWATVPFFNGQTIENVCVSSTGQYMLVVAYPISGFTRNLYLSSNYGSSWSTILTNIGTVNNLDISDNGQYIIWVTGTNSGNVFRSTDFGATFSTSGSPGASNWKGVAMSSSGQYVTIVSYNSWIWVSSNYGASYTAKTAYPSTLWVPVVMSSNGQYQVAGRGGAAGTIYRSTNFGSTWTNTGAPVSNGWGVLAMSGDGQRLLGLTNFRNTELYKSTNAGANWSTVTTIGSGGNGNWNCVAISPDGVTQLVGANGNVWPTDNIWLSTDSGANFSVRPGTDLGWNSISIGD